MFDAFIKVIDVATGKCFRCFRGIVNGFSVFSGMMITPIIRCWQDIERWRVKNYLSGDLLVFFIFYVILSTIDVFTDIYQFCVFLG